MSGADRESGYVLILVAGMMFLLSFCAALAIDVGGRAFAVKNQLQNAGDAGALAGAANAFPSTSYPAPDWVAALKAAKRFVAGNQVDGVPLEQAEVLFGWWNLNTNNWELGRPAAAGISPLQNSQGSCSSSGTACASDADCATGTEFCFFPDVPAVMATVAKSPGVNGGAVPTIFAGVLGWSEFQVAASAVAIADTPRAMPAWTVFPFALCQQVRDDFMSGTGPRGDITFTSGYSSGSGSLPSGGQWTGLTFGNPQGGSNTLVNYVQYLIDPSQGTPSPAVMVSGYHSPSGITYNSSIHIETGTTANLISATNDLIASGKTRVFMPVVANELVTGNMIVRGFVSVELTRASTPNVLTGPGRKDRPGPVRKAGVPAPADRWSAGGSSGSRTGRRPPGRRPLFSPPLAGPGRSPARVLPLHGPLPACGWGQRRA